MRIVVNETEDPISFRGAAGTPWTEVKPGEGQPLPEDYEGPVALVYRGQGSIVLGMVNEEELEEDPHGDMEALDGFKSIPVGPAINDDGSVEHPQGPEGSDEDPETGTEECE